MLSIAEADALDVLADDGLVAFPTETVWGIAARAKSEKAIGRLRAFKGRAADKPVSILIGSPGHAARIAEDWSAPSAELAERFWPGPLTLVVKALKGGAEFAPGVAGADGSIGIRCSLHPIASSLAAAAWGRGLGPVTATSLNRAGQSPARDRAEAARVCGDEIPMLDGEAGGEAASAVVDARNSDLRVLREGTIPAAALARQATDMEER